jgi:uncharacterized protein YlxW (UPF0749 family)
MSEQGGKRRWDRPDASMSLLADLLKGTGLDPGYEAAAARRAASGDRRSRTGRVSRLLAATVLLGLLGAVAVVQVRRGAPVAERQRNALIAQIHQRTGETDDLQRQSDALRGQTERLRRSALARSDAGRRARRDLDRAAAAAAAAPVSGSAAVITVADAPATRDSTAAQNGRIYDQDLQKLVNGLWTAGATAVAVNGQRMTATTAIRSAGDAILVDFRPLSPPYEIAAIGDPKTLRTTFVGGFGGSYLQVLQGYGITYTVEDADRLELPASAGVTLRHAAAPATADGPADEKDKKK